MMTDGLLIAFGVGVGFGWAIERAGLGSARKLAGQFYLTDFTVFKVMFSAIVTAMLGAYWLGRLDVIDLAAVHVPETFVLPQLIGGLVFGAGFVVAGLCPGTSCVAAATGRLDGLAVAAGIFAGILLTSAAFPWLARFYESSARGVWQLPAALGLPHGVVVFLVVLVALGGFHVVRRLERPA
jgi:uncharacterized membrane protein YedE/YeeE